jgi:hypothetical protein
MIWMVSACKPENFFTTSKMTENEISKSGFNKNVYEKPSGIFSFDLTDAFNE